MGMIRVGLWLVYELNKYAMNLYWLLWLRFWYTDNLTWFAHLIGVMSFLFMVSNLVYLLSGTEV